MKKFFFQKSMNYESILINCLLSLLFLCLTVASLQSQAITVEMRNGQKIIFSQAEMSQLEQQLSSLNPPVYNIEDQVAALDISLFRKLVEIGKQEYLTYNNRAARIESNRGISLHDLHKVRDKFLKDYTSYTVDHLRSNDTSLRLLGRDLNIGYHYLLTHLQAAGNPLTYMNRIELLRRIKLIHLSRKVAMKLEQNANHTPWVMRLDSGIGIDQSNGMTDHVDLVDLGYDGSIYKRLNHLINSKRNRYNWSMFWPSSKASNAINKLELTDFEKHVQTHWPKLATADGMSLNNDSSFRVGGIEHQAKWHQKIESFNSHTTHVMLDIDDTILKEVAIHVFEHHHEVQSLRYPPNAAKEKSYKAREGDRNLEKKIAGRVIHFRFHDNGELTSTVAVREGFKEFLRDNEQLLSSGLLEIYLTSANDENRTKAVWEQLLVDGKPLKDWGIKLIKKENFYDQGEKSFSKFRNFVGAGSSNYVFAIDDLGDAILGRNQAKTNQLFNITPWKHHLVNNQLLNGPNAEKEKWQDILYWRQISDDIYTSRFVANPNNILERLLVLARNAYFHSSLNDKL